MARSTSHARARTLADYGHQLGLSDDAILDTLCIALELAGPGVGGRYLGPSHPITDDTECAVALELLRTRAQGSGTFSIG